MDVASTGTSTSPKTKRIATATAIATALALPAEGLRRVCLRKTKGLKVGSASHEPAIDGLWINAKLSAPLGHDQSIPIVFNPSGIATNIRSPLWCISRVNTEGFEFCPPFLNPTVYGIDANTYDFRPLNHGFCFSINCDYVAVSSVSLLIFSARPYTVFFAVPKIVIDAINRESFWRLSHVTQKVSKIQPICGHGYTSSTVISPLFEILVSAPLDNSSPNTVCLSPMHAVPAVPVLNSPSGSQFARQATAAFCLTRYKVLNRRRRCVSTVAQTVPSPFVSFGNSGKPTKKHPWLNYLSTGGVAGMTAKASPLRRKPGARKRSAAMRAELCNCRHRPSIKIQAEL